MTLEVNSTSAINWNATGFERIIDNVANLIKTKRGEVPYMRDMGIDPEYIDLPLSISKGMIISDAVTTITTYEPKATVEEIEVNNIDNEGNIDTKVVISI